MTTPRSTQRKRRNDLLAQIQQLVPEIMFGTPAEGYRTCGEPTCRCHHGGPKHGPHLYVSFRGDNGKTANLYIPQNAKQAVRTGIEAWHTLQGLLRELADINREQVLADAKKARGK